MDATRRTYLATVVGATVVTTGCLGESGDGSDGSDGSDGEATDCSPVEESPVSDLPAPTLGPSDAPVTVMAFEDFACPHCATFSLEILPRLRTEFVDPGTVRYEHHDLPLPVDERWSWAVASAARGVQDETDDATFFEYAHALFENQDRYSLSLIRTLADEVGAPGCDVRADARTGTYRPVVEADRQRGIELGAQGTPAVFVDGQSVRPGFDAIASAIESAR